MVKETPFRNITTIGPAGSINSSVRQMAQWALLQLNRGKRGETQVISENTIKQMHSPQMVIDDPLDNELYQAEYVLYGLGWFIRPFRGHTLMHHGGNIDGFSALVSFMPDQNAGVVVLTNMQATFVTYSTVFSIFDRLLKLDPVDWNAKFKAFKDKLMTAVKESKEKSDTDRKLNTQPSHSIEDYVGEYENPGYGVFSIAKENDALYATINALKMRLDHYHYDIFEVVYETLNVRFKVFFYTDVKGNIDRLAVQLELSVKEQVFTRMPDKTMKDRAFLDPFVGKYELLPGMVLTVSLRGEDTLIVSIPGQPDAELVAYQGTTFNIKDAPGFSVEFKRDPAGAVLEAVVTQPNGVFVAKRLAD
jgi:hypothetical protein